MTDYKVDFHAMKQTQRDDVVSAIIRAGFLIERHGAYEAWRLEMKRHARANLGRVRRFYRYLSTLDNADVDKFLTAFLEF